MSQEHVSRHDSYNGVVTTQSSQVTVNNLCARCASFDIDDIFSLPDDSVDSRKICDLGDIAECTRVSSCPLCRLFYESCRIGGSISVGESASLYCARGNRNSWNQGINIFARTSRNSIKPWDVGGEAIGILRNSTRATRLGQLTLNRLAPVVQDFAFARAWIRECTETHYGCSLSEQSFMWPRHLRLINCATRKIEEPLLRVRYVALSYVWGSEKASNHTCDIGQILPHNAVPQCVEDAIHVAQTCGVKYLWVDRYCIEQVQSAQTIEQIGQMHRIYYAAYFTIVNTADKGPEAGLSGVSVLSRKPQCTVQLAAAEVVLQGQLPWFEVRDSIWNTRGWTYQEVFFSRRRLFFTPHQVYWQCRKEERLEVNPDIKAHSNLELHEWRPDSPSRILLLLSRYTQRKLTYEHDAIRAFMGILKFYEEQDLTVFHHYGVPILPYEIPTNFLDKTPTQSDRFVVGLCWVASSSGLRRETFPSWSWAGWCSQITYYTSPGSSMLPSTVGGLHVRVLLEDLNGDLIDFDTHPLSDLSSPTNLSPFIWVETLTIPICVEVTRVAPELRINKNVNTWGGTGPTYDFAIVEDTEKKLYIKAWLNNYTNWEDESSTQCKARNVIGLILERELAPFQDVEKQNVFLLLVQDVGSHYQRIGHALLTPDMMHIVPKGDNEVSATGSLKLSCKEIPWDLLLSKTSRQLIRLG